VRRQPKGPPWRFSPIVTMEEIMWRLAKYFAFYKLIRRAFRR
jgi:hypothetical protein